MYQAVFFDRKANTVHIWDDHHGHASFKYQPYAYKKKAGGKYKSIYGSEMEKVHKFHPAETGLWESDVPVETRVLIDAYGESDEVSVGHRLAILDIEVDSTGGYPKIDNPKQKVTAIAVYDEVAKHYYCFVLDENGIVKKREEPDKTVLPFRDEESLLLAFLDKWEEINPTVATGWNIDGFDFPYLHARLEAIFDERTAGRLSPIGICYFNKFKNKMTIAGVNCLDYLLLFKRYAQKNLPNYRLDTVGKEELKVGKIEFDGSIDELMRTDIEKFITYNLHDVVLVKGLNDKLQFIALAMSICHVCHVGYEEFHVSSKYLEGAMLTYLRRNHLVAPNKVFLQEDEDGDDGDDEKFIGAYVKDPIPGRYEWVCSADINSLYPSAIMTLNISPETKLDKIEGWDTDKFVRKELPPFKFLEESYTCETFSELIKEHGLSVSANGVVYEQRKVGCIPEILKIWFSERLEFKKKMKEASDSGDKEGTIFWKRRQHVQKILLNSLYGVVGMKGWRFYDKDNAEAITLTGQSIIKTSEKYVNNKLNKRVGTDGVDYIIAMDTDSLYINFQPLIEKEKPEDPKAFSIKTIQDTADSLNTLYGVMLPRMFNSELNRIVIAADVVAKAALWTSKKHYAMLKVYNMELSKDTDDLEIKGLDAVRSSYPKRFRDFMSVVLMDLLRSTNKKDLDEKILKFKADMKNFPLEEIAKNTSVKFISNTEDKINFDPRSRDPFNFVKGSTAQTKAALAYNDMLKKYELKETEPIMSGGKIKWAYLKDNPLGLDGLAFKDDGKDPKIIMDFIEKYIDRDKIWEKELQSKLEDFYNAVKWDIFSVDGAKIDEFFSF